METIRFSFNGGEVDTSNSSSAILIIKLEEELPSIFPQSKLAYHLEDHNEALINEEMVYHSICLGYETTDITWLIDLELLEDKLKQFNEGLQEHFEEGSGSWDPLIKVFLKGFGDKTYLWVRFFYHY